MALQHRISRSVLAAVLATSFLALACDPGKGASGEDLIHEKEGSTAQAVESGWTIEPSELESKHPLANDLDETHLVTAPQGTRKLRLFFPRIRMESSYDFLVIRDEAGNEIERVTGSHINYVSKTIPGRVAQITLETDYSVRSWGFILGHLRIRGCTHNAPADFTLTPVASCTELQDEIRTLAIAEIRRRFSEGHFYGPIRPLNRTSAEATAPAPAHSETNVQVAGVDEADIVKTDGNYIYNIAGRQLRVYRSWPVPNTELVHEVDLEGWPQELFLDGARAIVLSGVQADHWSPGPGPLPNVRMIAPPWWSHEAFTKVTVINFASGSPVVESETLLAGDYNTARRIGHSIRVVLRRNLSWPEIRYYPEGDFEYGSREWEAAMDQLEADAVQQVMRRGVADWVPTSYRIEAGQRVALPIACGDFLVPSNDQEIGLAAVATLELANPYQPTIQETTALLAVDQVYQSLDNLYLTSNHRWSCYEDAGTEGQFTYLHKLDVSAPTRASYRASGVVPGMISDQFWMDEYDDHLRVATNTNRWQAETEAERSINRVYVLAEQNGRLEQVGQTDSMAPGERIFGVRFLEDRGFVVTFRQVDPLFTIDLAQPSNPVIVGELKVPGFSTYLHPLDANHLFTIGQDFEPDGTTRNGVALSIFDVRDLAAPRLTHKAVIGTTRGNSEALYDHKAFSMYREPGRSDAVLAIPFTDYGPAEDNNFWGTFESTLKVFRVSPLGILGLGALDHSDLFADGAENQFGWWYRPNVRRGVFVDQYVYALSDAGLKVSPIVDPLNVLVSIARAPQYENPNPTPTTISDEATSLQKYDIPDADLKGIRSAVELTEDLEIRELSVELQIAHSYRGDLEIRVEHDGVTEVLHNRSGGSQDDLRRTFQTERFRGMTSAGVWTLTVIDHASRDIGVLEMWTVRAIGVRPSGTPTPAPILERTYESRMVLDIPDESVSGVTSEIEVPDALAIESLVLEVDITHSYRGDLVVSLEHGGVETIVHDRTGGSLDDLRLRVDLDDFEGVDARGTWTLRVADSARYDLGQLEGWRLSMSGEQL